MSGERIYRTAGGRHVPEGHPDAAFLAYSPADEVPAEVLAELHPAGGDEDKGEADGGKQRPPAANKARARTPNKASG